MLVLTNLGCWLVYDNEFNKQCGRRVRPTRYSPAASNHDLWQFDLETGVRVASKVGNLPSKFGDARPLGYRIIRYVYATDGQTDGRTDKSNAYCPISYGRGTIT